MVENCTKNWIYKYEDEKKHVYVFGDNGRHKTKSYNFSRNINQSWHDCGCTGQIIYSHWIENLKILHLFWQFDLEIFSALFPGILFVIF